MRGSIIEELYYGNIDPQDRGYRPKLPAKKASDSLNDLEEKLTEQLVGENKALFLRFCNAYAEFMGIRYNNGPVDKSKNSAETHSGSSRTVNLGIAKDGIYHPLEV